MATKPTPKSASAKATAVKPAKSPAPKVAVKTTTKPMKAAVKNPAPKSKSSGVSVKEVKIAELRSGLGALYGRPA